MEEVETQAADLFSELLPDTPELIIPEPEPEAHRGKITGITVETYDTGTTGIIVSLKSTDTGLKESLKIFPPAEFVENIAVDPATLSTEPKPGKKQSPRERYGSVVRNHNKDAELQKLLALASEQGRTAAGARPTDFGEFVAMLDQLLTDVPVIFVRRPDAKAEGSYKNKLKVTRINSFTTIDDPKKYYKKVNRMWEQVEAA